MDWIFDPVKFAEVLKELDEDAVKIPALRLRLGLDQLERDAEADTRKENDADR